MMRAALLTATLLLLGQPVRADDNLPPMLAVASTDCRALTGGQLCGPLTVKLADPSAVAALTLSSARPVQLSLDNGKSVVVPAGDPARVPLSPAPRSLTLRPSGCLRGLRFLHGEQPLAPVVG